jgi:hypothetical protein
MTKPAMTKPAMTKPAMTEPATSEAAESEAACPSDVSRYERACDEAIAMCDGNMRSTIKALIMANEYLEAELQELQATTSRDGNTARLPAAKDDAA